MYVGPLCAARRPRMQPYYGLSLSTRISCLGAKKPTPGKYLPPSLASLIVLNSVLPKMAAIGKQVSTQGTISKESCWESGMS